MMIFNSNSVANDYNFGVQRPNGRGRRFFLPTNKTLKAFVQLLRGNFFKRSSDFLLYLKSFCKKKNIKSSFQLVCEQVNLIKQHKTEDNLHFKQKTFSPVLSINSSQKDKALPLKLPNRTSSLSSCIQGTVAQL